MIEDEKKAFEECQAEKNVKEKNQKPFFNISKRETEDYIKELEKRSKEIGWDAIPDAEATVEQVKDWSRFNPQSKICFCDGGISRGGEHSEDICFWGKLPTPINYWKYACIAILLGIVTAMALSTPTIISLFDACVQ